MLKKILIYIALASMLTLVGVTTYRYLNEYTSDFIDHSLRSEVLQETRKIFVRLPKGYDTTQSYPLIIRSDGNFNLERWHQTIEAMAFESAMKDSILVSIPNQFWTETRNRDLVPPYARQDVQIEARPEHDKDPNIFGKADKFLAFIETELLPFMEENYAINNNRVLSGFSAGGSFVLYTITTKPELFNGYFAFSPAAWYDDSVVVEEFSKRLPMLNGEPKFLYLSIGGAENSIITGSFEGLLAALKSKAPANLYSDHSYSEGANHSENPYVSVPKALASYYQFRIEHF